MESARVRGAQPELSAFINVKHQVKRMGAMASSRWRSEGRNSIGQGAAVPEEGLLGPPFGWLLPMAILNS